MGAELGIKDTRTWGVRKCTRTRWVVIVVGGGAAGGISWVGVRAAEYYRARRTVPPRSIRSAPVENRCQVMQPGRGQRGPQLRGETVPSALQEGRPCILPRAP